MASAAQRGAVSRYDKTHTKQFKLKLNLVTDADIIGFLEYQCPNKQGFIKRLIREYRYDTMGAGHDPRSHGQEPHNW